MAKIEIVKLSDIQTIPSEEEFGTLQMPTASKPRFIVTVDDVQWPFVHGCIEQVGFSLTGVFSFDSIYTEVSNADGVGAVDPTSPLGKLMLPVPLDQAPTRHRVKIYGGYTDVEQPTIDDLQNLLFDGFVDRIKGHISKNIVTVTGKDPSVIFQESYTHAQFRNRSITDVVAELAEKYDFDAFIVDSGVMLGNVYDYERIDFEYMSSQGINNWEILTKLADYVGYRVFCIGKKLYFMPLEQADSYLAFTLGENIDELGWEKNYSVAASRISVQFLSSNTKTKDNVLITAGQPRSEAGAKGDRADFTFTTNQRDLDQLELEAEAMVLRLAQFENVVEIHTTGAPQQSVRKGIILRGTGSDFDRTYQIARIKWDFGYEIGWTTEVTGLSLPQGASVKLAKKRTRFGVQGVR